MQLIVRNTDLSLVPVSPPKSHDFSGRAYSALLTARTASAFKKAIQEFVGGLSQNPTEREMLLGLMDWVRLYSQDHGIKVGLNTILANAQGFYPFSFPIKYNRDKAKACIDQIHLSDRARLPEFKGDPAFKKYPFKKYTDSVPTDPNQRKLKSLLDDYLSNLKTTKPANNNLSLVK